jgi:tryptophan 2,3-dioxygenase
MTPTYSSYLKLDELLSLQRPLSPEKSRDELLFIIIHQAYELWFKEVLHELDHLQVLLAAGEFHRAQFSLKRVRAVLNVMLAQFEVLETMLPRDFLCFRDRLETASGFQSIQFRELEFALGHKRRHVFSHLPETSAARQQLEKRYRDATLWDALLRGLSRSGYAIPEAALHRDVTQPITPCPQIQQVLLDIYEGVPAHIYLFERLLDMDEGFQEWRYRHVKMVERMIGTKPGTGGSEGVGYLKSTLFKPFFPDLWAVRSEMQIK